VPPSDDSVSQAPSGFANQYARKPPVLTEEDQETISLGVKNIGNGVRHRSGN